MRTSFTLGTTFSETFTPAECPASAGWVLSLRLAPRDGSDTAVTLTGSADGDSHVVTASAAVTANWVGGEYSWMARATLSGVVRDVGRGQITLNADPFTTNGALDSRSAAEVALADAKAALAAWKPTTKRYKINGREMEFNSPADILKVISYWQTEVTREQNAALIAAGMKTRRRVYLRLGNV